MMLKKLMTISLALAIALAMTLAFTACGGSDQAAEEGAEATEATETEEAAEQMSGGWEVVAEPAQSALPDVVQEAFDQFMKNYDDELIPMAYYGKQESSLGTNYQLLCKSTNDNELETVVLHEDPDLGMDAVINQFIIADYTEGSGAALDGDPDEGEWEVSDSAVGSQITEEAQAAYDNAKASYDGTAPQPLTLLGTQVVAGTNYAFLAKGQTETDNPRSAVQVVIVYEDLEGNAQITNINTLDMGEYDD